MKLTKAEKLLLRRIGQKGGFEAQKKRSEQEKKLYSQKMNEAKRAKRYGVLTPERYGDMVDTSNSEI